MSVTATAAPTLGLALEQANPNTLADALRKVNLSKMLEPQKLVLSALATPLAAVTLDPPALVVQSARILTSATGATATVGLKLVGDSAFTPTSSACKLSDDGKTLTFDGTVSDAIVVYMARSEASLSDAFPTSPSK